MKAGFSPSYFIGCATVVYIHARNAMRVLYMPNKAVYFKFFQLSSDQQQIWTHCIEDEIEITVIIDFRYELTITLNNGKMDSPPSPIVVCEIWE